VWPSVEQLGRAIRTVGVPARSTGYASAGSDQRSPAEPPQPPWSCSARRVVSLFDL